MKVIRAMGGISKVFGAIALALSANLAIGLVATCAGDPPDDSEEDVVIVERAGTVRRSVPHVDAAPAVAAPPVTVARR
jgi:hypothetical protein